MYLRAQGKYDLAVAWRVYPGVTKTPPIFENDKLKLVELNLSTFKKSLGSLKVKFFAILDNCPPQYDELVEKYFDKNDLELIHCNKIGNQATFGKQIEILANQNDAEIVYFCEDDYFYLPNKFRAMIKFIKEKDVDFITPYDTIEYYNLKLHDYPSHVRICGNLHWRTVASTTCTFMTKRTTLLKVKKILHLYTKHKLLDLGIFLCLTKKNLFKPVKVFNTIKSQRFRARMYINVWRYGFKQILFGKKYQLWEPIPSIATHLQKTRIAPVINWPELYEKEIKELFG